MSAAPTCSNCCPVSASGSGYLHVVQEREPGNDRPVLGVDIAGRVDEILALRAAHVELPVVEVVAHHSDVFPLVERNASFFRGQVEA